MSSGDGYSDRLAPLIERLLVDPAFRAEFRRDPGRVCAAAGLPELAAEFGGSGKATETLELRESRSSLAGVVMAFAAEGVAFEGAHHLPADLPGPLARMLRSVKLPPGLRRLEHLEHRNPLGHLESKAEHATGISPQELEQLRHSTGSPASSGTGAASGAGGAPIAAGSGGPQGAAGAPAAAAGSVQSAAGAAAGSSAAAGVAGRAVSSAPAAGSVVPSAPAAGSVVPSAPAAGSPAPVAVPTPVAVVESTPAAGSAGAANMAAPGVVVESSPVAAPISQTPVPVPSTGAAAAPIVAAPSAGSGAPQAPAQVIGGTEPPAVAAGHRTIAFEALGHGPQLPAHNTVKFLQAVQPSAGSSTVPSTASSTSAGSPQEQAVLAQSPQQGLVTAAEQHPQAAGAAVADQLIGAVSPGSAGPISVSSTLLTSGQAIFAGKLAQLTGLDPQVIAAWELAEESGSAAQARQAASNFNWLNIGYFDSGAGQIAFAKAFSDPATAAEQTAEFLKGQWANASAGIQAILSTVGKGSEDQMHAIATSGWASSGYYGGSTLRATFDELDGNIKITSAAPPVAAVSPAEQSVAAVPSAGEVVESVPSAGEVVESVPAVGRVIENSPAPAAAVPSPAQDALLPDVSPSGTPWPDPDNVPVEAAPAIPVEAAPVSYEVVAYPAGQYPAVVPAGTTPAEQVVGQFPSAPMSLGLAGDPAGAGKVDAMVQEANSLLGKPYVWGGGHAGWGPQPGYDCSGFVSRVLHAGGFLSEPCDTESLVGQPGIEPGPGQFITIYDRTDAGIGNDHVIVDINGQFYESGGEKASWGGGGGVEKIERPSAAYLATFNRMLHPAGL